jgi:hypothetical protein
MTLDEQHSAVVDQQGEPHQQVHSLQVQWFCDGGRNAQPS